MCNQGRSKYHMFRSADADSGCSDADSGASDAEQLQVLTRGF